MKPNEKHDVLSIWKTLRLRFGQLNPFAHSQGDASAPVKYNLMENVGNIAAEIPMFRLNRDGHWHTISLRFRVILADISCDIALQAHFRL